MTIMNPTPFVLLLLSFLQAPDPMAEGTKALEANNYQLAALSFKQAVEKDPKDFTAHFYLALSRSLLKDDAEAVAEYRKTLELKPGLYEAELNLGIVLVRTKQFADAVAPLTEAAGQKPGEPRPHYYLGEALLGSGDFEKAAAAFEVAATADGKSAGAQLGWAKALAKEKKLDEAAPHFQKAAELDANYRDGLLELADEYEKAGQPAKAVEIYKQFPENVAAQERMGELLIETKKYGDAIPGLEKAVAASPTSANRLALATAYGLTKQFDKELQLLALVVAAEPRDFSLRMRYGRALRDQRKLPQAQQQFLVAANIQSDSVEALNELASVAIVMQDYATGLKALDQVRALGKEKPGDLFYRALALDKLVQRKPAIAAYQQFLAVSGGKFPDQEFQARQRIHILKLETGQK